MMFCSMSPTICVDAVTSKSCLIFQEKVGSQQSGSDVASQQQGFYFLSVNKISSQSILVNYCDE